MLPVLQIKELIIYLYYLSIYYKNLVSTDRHFIHTISAIEPASRPRGMFYLTVPLLLFITPIPHALVCIGTDWELVERPKDHF